MRSTLILLLGSILLLVACRDKEPAASPVVTTLKLDSSLGIGNKIQSFFLPGRIVAVNPDSVNRVIIVGKDGKIIRTIYRNIDSASRPHILNKVTVDSATMEIYIYCPLEHQILVYDTGGNYKNSIGVKEVHKGGFSRINGEFFFFDKPDSANPLPHQ